MADIMEASQAKVAAKIHEGGTFEAAKAKAAGKVGIKAIDNGDGTYTVSGKLGDSAWSKTFLSTKGTTQSVGHPDPGYVEKVKAILQKNAGADQIGQDSNGDGQYGAANKSLEAGKGGRSQLLHDRITLQMCEKGYSHEQSDSVARTIVSKNAAAKGYVSPFAKTAAGDPAPATKAAKGV